MWHSAYQHWQQLVKPYLCSMKLEVLKLHFSLPTILLRVNWIDIVVAKYQRQMLSTLVAPLLLLFLWYHEKIINFSQNLGPAEVTWSFDKTLWANLRVIPILSAFTSRFDSVAPMINADRGYYSSCQSSKLLIFQLARHQILELWLASEPLLSKGVVPMCFAQWTCCLLEPVWAKFRIYWSMQNIKAVRILLRSQIVARAPKGMIDQPLDMVYSTCSRLYGAIREYFLFHQMSIYTHTCIAKTMGPSGFFSIYYGNNNSKGIWGHNHSRRCKCAWGDARNFQY